MRKNFIRTFVALLLILSLTGTTAFAESASVTGNAVNLRSGPGRDYSVMRKVGRGDELIFLGEKQKDRYNRTWMRVSVYGLIGWVRADKVK